jgi:hypothetical protein
MGNARLPVEGAVVKSLPLCMFGIVSWVLLGTATWAADAPPQPANGPPAAKEAKGVSAPVRGLDALKLPPGSIIVLCEQPKDALQLLPKFVVLAPEKYQELMDQIAHLKRQAAPSQPLLPSECKLSGRVDGGSVHLTAEFRFKTEQPREVVFLGCLPANAGRAELDPGSGGDKFPVALDPGETGYTVRVATPGEHNLILEMQLPLASREAKGSEQVFELNLPGAAITTLEQLDVAEGVADLRLTSRFPPGRNRPAVTETVSAKRLQAKSGPAKAVYLGPVEQLEVAWKSPAPRPAGPPLLATESDIKVRVEDTSITTEAVLTLKALLGETEVWRLQVPPTAVVSEPRLSDERIQEMDLPRENAPELTIRLRQPSKELKVVLKVRQARPAPGQRVPIGPFAVLAKNLLHQKGTLTVSAPADLRVRPHLRGAGVQREVAEDPRPDHTVAAYTFGNWPAPGEVERPVPPLLDLEIEPVKGLVETRTVHKLRLVDHAWQLTSQIEVLHCPTGIDRLDIQVPPRLKLAPQVTTSFRESIAADESTPGVFSVNLGEKQYQRFSVTLTGQYDPPAAGEQHLAVELPRLLETADRNARLEAVLPAEYEFVPDGPGPGTPGERNRRTWTWDRSPGAVELAWRAYRPELPVSATADVTLAGTQARVRHQLQFHFPDKPADHVLLRGPDELLNLVRVEHGGEFLPLTANPAKPGTAWAGPLTGTAGKKDTLTLLYSPRLPEKGHRIALPLLWPAEATRVETKVRVWCDPGLQLSLLSKGWEEQPVEIVRDNPSLPTLVLRASRADLPLGLGLTAPTGVPLATVVADRTYLQTAVSSDGYQRYHARLWLSRLNVRHLDVGLPAPPAVAKLEAYLGGKGLTWQPVADSPSVARLPIEPERFSVPLLLELRYEIAPNQTEGNGPFGSTLFPPAFPEGVLSGPLRWAVTLPAGWVPLHVGGGYLTDQRWGWRGWLLAPRPVLSSAALEDWFQGGSVIPPDAEPEATLVCRGTALKPLGLLLVPQQQVWLLGCSLALLLVGLVLGVAPLPRGLFWPLLALLGAGLLLTAVLWPVTFRAFVFGCQPGVLVLLVVVLVQFTLHRRYRRQVVFLPGFRRRKSGSSLVRTGSSPRLREPSTVDEPPKVESALAAKPRSNG